MDVFLIFSPETVEDSKTITDPLTEDTLMYPEIDVL